MNLIPRTMLWVAFIWLPIACKQKTPSPTAKLAESEAKNVMVNSQATEANESGADQEVSNLDSNQKERERLKQEALARIQNLSESETLVLAARSTPQGLIAKKRVEKRISPSEQLNRCQAGHLESCHRYGWHEQNQGNLKNAQSFYEVSCRKGILKSCNNLGWLSEKRGQISVALDYYSQACLKKHPGSCSNLKRALEKAKSFR